MLGGSAIEIDGAAIEARCCRGSSRDIYSLSRPTAKSGTLSVDLWDDPEMRYLNGRFLASVVLAAAILAVGVMRASAAAPVKITNCNTAASRPKLLTLTCGDGNTVLKGLTWSSFGGASAQAKGTFVTNTCEPNCAAGKDVSYPITAKVTSPRACKGGLRVYGKLAIKFTGRAPGPGIPRNWKLGCPIQ